MSFAKLRLIANELQSSKLQFVLQRISKQKFVQRVVQTVLIGISLIIKKKKPSFHGRTLQSISKKDT